MTIARAIHQKSADIFVSENHLKHIGNKHANELRQIGLTAKDLVSYVCQNFNQIRKGSGNSILLVVYNAKLPFVAAIELNLGLRNEFWEVKTAEPRRTSAVDKKALLWQEAKPSRSSNGKTLLTK